MSDYLELAKKDRSMGYTREYLRQDVLYGYCNMSDFALSVSRKDGTVTRIDDRTALGMLEGGYVTKEQYEEYIKLLNEDIYRLDRFDGNSSEELYGYVYRVRKAVFGKCFDRYLVSLAAKKSDFLPNGIDQSEKKNSLLSKNKAVICILTQAELFSLMLEDLDSGEGKEKWVLCDSALHGLLPENVNVLETDGKGIFADRVLQEHINNGQAALMFYGEEGLTFCRGLLVDSVVYAIPAGYYGQAVTGLWKREGCIVYVPLGMDITKTVPLIKKTELNYCVLFELWKAYGDEIYGLSPDELYSRYPRYFINVYGGKKSHLPLDIKAKNTSDFDRQLDRELEKYLSSFENAEYKCAYFDENLEQKPISYDSTVSQKGILVQAVKIKKAENARVIGCEKGKTPRQTFEEMKLSGTGIVSNFLFFMTPKLGVLYNDLRAARPFEQADAAPGHLDYMLKDGKEYFPLFAKACIAMKEDGSFKFFNYRLGGGRVRISGVEYSWKKENINSVGDDVIVYAPTLGAKDREADRNTYKLPVGEGRVNLVLLRDKVTCIRKGSVLLPSVGVVLSLTEKMAQPLLELCKQLSEGYYDVSGLTLEVKLDPPDGISCEEWEKVVWAYGGGLTLIKEGVGLCDGDNMEKWFDEEGWTNPLSRQTQESNLHSLVKHPRTAIGCTSDGGLVILVYSGRTWRSTGADYAEMISIARGIFPDVKYLMNCDGGGSAMLGMVDEGSFLELSFPSTSSGSCAGQVRPINTLFYIPID